jgi:metallophosphoesterase (TIGR00282 family)
MEMKVLIVGDVVGKGGRHAARRLIPELRDELDCHFCVCNGENIAGGAGLTAKCVNELHRNGADVVTSGDHVWGQKGFEQEINELPFVLRPSNLDSEQPGIGYGVFTSEEGIQVAVINLIGRVFIGLASNCPFREVDYILDKLDKSVDVIIVDFHAEATSEKIAMGRHLDGRVSCVYGTHTHVQTSDNTVFPGGTAYITDVGMVGGVESILGRDIEPVVYNFVTGMKARFKVTETGIRLHGAMVTIDSETGRATSIERVVRDYVPD